MKSKLALYSHLINAHSLKPKTQCTIFGCSRWKSGIVKQSWWIRNRRDWFTMPVFCLGQPKIMQCVSSFIVNDSSLHVIWNNKWNFCVCEFKSKCHRPLFLIQLIPNWGGGGGSSYILLIFSLNIPAENCFFFPFCCLFLSFLLVIDFFLYHFS